MVVRAFGSRLRRGSSSRSLVVGCSLWDVWRRFCRFSGEVTGRFEAVNCCSLVRGSVGPSPKRVSGVVQRPLGTEPELVGEILCVIVRVVLGYGTIINPEFVDPPNFRLPTSRREALELRLVGPCYPKFGHYDVIVASHFLE